MPKPIIEVENLSKRYNRRAITPFCHKRESDIIWALKDVSYSVQPGEILGIIGRNGAGKSTLLKILSQITEPTAGKAVIRGRTSALLGIGTGFHAELPGRENIYLNGTILGMRKKEIDQKFDEIVAFAEIEDFIDTPLKHYSSGMYVRLAFAVAAHLDAEILLIDEILAVGDVRFQRKCIDKMGKIGKEGRTVLFVSHNMPAVMRLCPRIILLHEGKIIRDDHSHLVIKDYLQAGLGVDTIAMKEWPDLNASPGDDAVRLRSIRVQDKKGQTREVVDIDQPIGIEMVYDVIKPGAVLVPSCRITNYEGVILFQTDDWNLTVRRVGRYNGITWIPANLLAEGTFFVSVGIATVNPTIKRIFEQDAVAFQAIDHMDKGGMRSMWGGDHPGVIRPNLPWQTTGPI